MVPSCEQVQAKPVNSAPGIANPAPLGLLCFGMTTVMLMFITTKWAEATTLNSVITYACFYGGFGQMVAGIFEVRAALCNACWSTDNTLVQNLTVFCVFQGQSLPRAVCHAATHTMTTHRITTTNVMLLVTSDLRLWDSLPLCTNRVSYWCYSAGY